MTAITGADIVVTLPSDDEGKSVLGTSYNVNQLQVVNQSIRDGINAARKPVHIEKAESVKSI
jgi:hypothetical protein